MVAAALSVLTTRASRPVKPGPKPSVIRSLAARVGLPIGAVLASGSASRMSIAGRASAPRPSTPASSNGTRNRITWRAQRKPAGSRRTVWSRVTARRGSTRRPAKPSSAGSRVTATSTATATVPAAARPITVRNGMPTRASPASAMTTVPPAKSTAEPAVPRARPAASGGGTPSRTCCR